jgi:16S rRNA U1498 N3-methylase RsmE
MKKERNSLILTEAAEQCERFTLPEIEEITEFKNIFTHPGKFYFFDSR